MFQIKVETLMEWEIFCAASFCFQGEILFQLKYTT
jgi:hypothetical protein